MQQGSAAAAAADDGFDDLFGAGFEELAEEEETGGKSERERHAKVTTTPVSTLHYGGIDLVTVDAARATSGTARQT